MVGRYDYNGIYIRSSQQFAIVIISFAAVIGSAGTVGGVGFINKPLAVLSPKTIHIAYGQYLNLPVANEAA
jgi:hypothetical protein